ncbi:M17 family metallopeptidase [Mycoplasma miroungirhinis]|uniref:Probable cytosol aminopeptidase n=1 Tax=Mycoplasma miroungirhinis TaxID=754516 RepID=A0A6M4JE74_9MOLU|nr:M17 family metallopeptidase [Mycoplasma miroungirhinis]QJR44397.1 leucyl aminopeptidase family protein [Mycoplasma miroungirhinis]
MNKNYIQTKNDFPLLKAVFNDSNVEEFVSKNKLALTLDNKNNILYFYVNTIDNYTQLISKVNYIIENQDQNLLIDIKSFVNENVSYEDALRAFYLRNSFFNDEIYNQKTDKQDPKYQLDFFLETDEYRQYEKKLNLLVENTKKTRNLQITPPNICTSEWLADYIEKDFQNIENVTVKILKRQEIEELGMGLMLSVNAGSLYEPRVVVIEYLPLKDSKEKITIVGKGITYDSGGYNIKTNGYMNYMKMDMSGSVIAAYALKNIAQNKIKTNVSVVMMITDNKLNNNASVPDNVYVSMSKKTVEIVDTDAEGRLVLADGITYAKDVLKATTIIDVATLTGTILTALGDKYTGIYTNSDTEWKIFALSAKLAQEKVWRMPLHEDFNKPNKESLVADLLNCSTDAKLSDCNIAASFLYNFATEKVNFIHCDVAGTAEDENHKPLAALVATLTEYAIQKENQ